MGIIEYLGTIRHIQILSFSRHTSPRFALVNELFLQLLYFFLVFAAPSLSERLVCGQMHFHECIKAKNTVGKHDSEL